MWPWDDFERRLRYHIEDRQRRMPPWKLDMVLLRLQFLWWIWRGARLKKWVHVPQRTIFYRHGFSVEFYWNICRSEIRPNRLDWNWQRSSSSRFFAGCFASINKSVPSCGFPSRFFLLPDGTSTNRHHNNTINKIITRESTSPKLLHCRVIFIQQQPSVQENYHEFT